MIYKAKYVLPGGGAVIKDGAVLVFGREIVAVGSLPEVFCEGESVEDLGNCVLMPGFVNAHSHIEATLSRNTSDALNLWDWLNNLAFRKDSLPPADVVKASAELGAAEMALSGVTCIGDSAHTGMAVDAVDNIGLRGVVYKELFGQRMGTRYPEKCVEVLRTIEEMQNRASERVRVGLSPHSVYTSSKEVLRFCGETGLPVALHLAETEAERLYTTTGTGPLADWRRKLGYEPMVSGVSPVRVLEGAGLLRVGVSLAHCVDLEQDEVALIGKSGAAVAHCPRSNSYLGAGVARITQLRRAGAVVALGTDSAGSCMRLDFFEEMRFALGLARAAARDAGVVTAGSVIEMATFGGAEALGLGHIIGRLQPGMRADMVAVDVSTVLPGEDLHLAVLSRGPKDVIMTMVDGEEIVRKGQLARNDIAVLECRLQAAMES